MTLEEAKVIANQFEIEGTLIYAEPFGCGHINTTYMLCYVFETKPPVRYILQKLNTTIFTDTEGLMNNISLVTNFLKEKIITAGGDPNRETLTLYPTKEGKPFLSYKGSAYRVYNFIEHATCYQSATPELFYSSAKAFAKFARQLDVFDPSVLIDTIEKFHDTENRYQNFMTSVNQDCMDRKKLVAPEIDFVQTRHEFCSIILNEIEAGTIPLRVCHNDTKLNNVMIDNDSQEGICVIDLDTVMKGSLLYDFGDSIRFGASTGAEDEEDLTKVSFDLEKYRLYVKGYLEECLDVLTKKEFELLAHGAILMTLECGIRFLADYLDGDIYFKVHKPNHNLIRARNQFHLVRDMERKLPEMIAINESLK